MKKGRKKERYEVLYEDIEAMFKTVTEGHSTLDRKIDGVLGEVKAMRAELGDVEKAVTESRQRLDTLISRFEIHVHPNAN